jgi:hypothetical protein
VLYLREFAIERQAFGFGKSKDLARYLLPAGLPRAAAPSLWLPTGSVSCELFLSAAIERDLGPFIALGNPEDHTQPLGAARSYPTDESWQRVFSDFSHRAQAIILLAGCSMQVSWELEYILSHGMANKLFVIDAGGADARKGWFSFRMRAQAIGYQLPEKSPAPGSMVGFDSNGCGAYLVQNPTVPEDFTLAISSHLAR